MRLVLPHSGGVQIVGVGLQNTCVIALQIFALGWLDGHFVVVTKLEEEVHRGVATAEHARLTAHHPVFPRGVWEEIQGIMKSLLFLFNKIKTELETLLKCKQTSQAIGSISELQAKDIIWWAVGVQGAGHLPAANEAVLPSQNDEGSVDELHQELLGLTWKKHVYKIKSRDMIVLLKCST